MLPCVNVIKFSVIYVRKPEIQKQYHGKN